MRQPVCVLIYSVLTSNKIEGRISARVFENRLLRRVFGHKRDEVTGKWRKLHNEELNVLYPHPILFG